MHRHGELAQKWEISMGSCLALYRHCSEENTNGFGALNIIITILIGYYNDIQH